MNTCTVIFAILGLTLCLSNQDKEGGSCPPLKQYSADLQKRAAAEIRAKKAPTLSKLTTDYGQLRDACRLESR